MTCERPASRDISISSIVAFASSDSSWVIAWRSVRRLAAFW
jgi:hypothetical protein